MATYRSEGYSCTNPIYVPRHVEVNETTPTVHRDHNVWDADIAMKDPSLKKVLDCWERLSGRSCVEKIDPYP